MNCLTKKILKTAGKKLFQIFNVIGIERTDLFSLKIKQKEIYFEYNTEGVILCLQNHKANIHWKNAASCLLSHMELSSSLSSL